jgi:hypothetical protein
VRRAVRQLGGAVGATNVSTFLSAVSSEEGLIEERELLNCSVYCQLGKVA